MSTYGSGAVFQAVWLPVVPLKAMAGILALLAAVAAPTVPDTCVVSPVFAETLSAK